MNTLAVGDSMKVGQELHSNDEIYILVMQYDCNLVLYAGTRKVLETGKISINTWRSTQSKVAEASSIVDSNTTEAANRFTNTVQRETTDKAKRQNKESWHVEWRSVLVGGSVARRFPAVRKENIKPHASRSRSRLSMPCRNIRARLPRPATRHRLSSMSKEQNEQLHHKATRPLVCGGGQPLGDTPRCGSPCVGRVGGGLGGALIGLYLGRRSQLGGRSQAPKESPVKD
jgi:hypothetical protein